MSPDHYEQNIRHRPTEMIAEFGVRSTYGAKVVN